MTYGCGYDGLHAWATHHTGDAPGESSRSSWPILRVGGGQWWNRSHKVAIRLHRESGQRMVDSDAGLIQFVADSGTHQGGHAGDGQRRGSARDGVGRMILHIPSSTKARRGVYEEDPCQSMLIRIGTRQQERAAATGEVWHAKGSQTRNAALFLREWECGAAVGVLMEMRGVRES